MGQPLRLDQLLLCVTDVSALVCDHLSMHGVVRLGTASRRLHWIFETGHNALLKAMMRHFPALKVTRYMGNKYMLHGLSLYHAPCDVRKHEISYEVRSILDHVGTPLVFNFWLEYFRRLRGALDTKNGREMVVAAAMAWKDIIQRKSPLFDDNERAIVILDDLIKRVRTHFVIEYCRFTDII